MLCKAMYGYVWLCMAMYGCVGPCRAMYASVGCMWCYVELCMEM